MQYMATQIAIEIPLSHSVHMGSSSADVVACPPGGESICRTLDTEKDRRPPYIACVGVADGTQAVACGLHRMACVRKIALPVDEGTEPPDARA